MLPTRLLQARGSSDASPCSDVDPELIGSADEYADTAEPVPMHLQAPADFGAPYLRPYQQDAAYTILRAQARVGVHMTLDATETGLGKTWVALEVVRRLGCSFGVVCPANVVHKWTTLAISPPFNLTPSFVVSYERLRSGRLSSLVTRSMRRGRKRSYPVYRWQAPPALIIFDEVHCASNLSSCNGSLLLSALRLPLPTKVHALSATIANSPLGLQVTGYGLSLHHGVNDWWGWCQRMGARKAFFGGLEFDTGSSAQRRSPTARQASARAGLRVIHEHIFPQRGVRITKQHAAIDTEAPPCYVIPELIELDLDAQCVQPELVKLESTMAADVDSAIVSTMRERQLAELGKVTELMARGEHLLRQRNSVVIFVNFTATIELLSAAFQHVKHLTLVGGLAPARRQRIIDRFQANDVRLLICQLDVASTAIDLDDRDGRYPRCVLISPSYNERQLLQCLGRAHRMTTRSAVIQWVLFAQGTVEERLCALVQQKLHNLSTLTDGEFGRGLDIDARRS